MFWTMGPRRELRFSEKVCVVSVSPQWNPGNSATIFSSRALLIKFLRTVDVCSLVSGEYQFVADAATTRFGCGRLVSVHAAWGVSSNLRLNMGKLEATAREMFLGSRVFS